MPYLFGAEVSKRPKSLILLILSVILIAGIAAFFLLHKEEKKSADPMKDVRQGWLEFRMGEYKRAISFFKSAANSLRPGSDDQLKALYSLACAYWLKAPDDDKPSAEAVFKKIIEVKPDSDYAAWSMLALVRMKHIVPAGETPNFPAVREEYLKIYEKFPDHIAGHEAFIYMAGTYLATLDKKDAEFARTGLGEFISLHPDSPFISSAWGLYSTACDRLGDKDAMLHAKIKSLETLEIDRTNPRVSKSNIYWSIAVIAEFEAGDFETAKKYYSLFMEEYPKDRLNFAAGKALARIAEMEKSFAKDAEGTGRQ